jgi:outer membrane protein
LVLSSQVTFVFNDVKVIQQCSMMKSKLSIVPTIQKPSVSRSLSFVVGASIAMFGPITSWSMDLMFALRDATRQDSQLASAQAQLRAVQQRLPITQSLFLPTVNASANLSQQWSEVNTNPAVSYMSQGLTLNLSQPVYRLANVSTLEQSKLSITQAEANLASSQQDLALRVAQAYFEVLISQDALITLRAQEKAISLQFEAAKRNFEVGTATITDQQEAQARLDLTRASVAASQNDLQTKVANLTLLVGERPNVVYALEPKVVLPSPSPAKEGEWVSAARLQNFGVLQSEISVEVAKREIDKQRAANYPNLDAVASTGLSKGSSPFNPSAKLQTNSIGFQVSVPLYTGGAIAARIAEATALYEKARQDAETARRTAEQGARSAFLSVNSLMAQAKALEEAEKSSALALESNELGYQVGVRINIDVLNALQQLSSTRRDLSKARYDALLTGLRLKSAAGSLTADDLRSVNAMLKAERPVDIPQDLSGTVFDVPVKIGQPLKPR